ncbi:MAG: hypothetical protein QM636_14115 [Rhizobium sp.]
MTSAGSKIQINGPYQAGSDAYRALEREEILAVAYSTLVQIAVAAGWKEAEVALTLADIADDYVMALAQRVAMDQH